MAQGKPSYKQLHELSLGTGCFFGLHELQLNIPFMEAGDVFSVTVNGTAISVPYTTDYSNTILLIKQAIEGATDIREAYHTIPSLSRGYFTNGTSAIRFVSNVDGQEIIVLDPIITKANTAILQVGCAVVSPLKEYSYIPIGGVCGAEPIPVEIDLTEVIEAIRKKKDYEPLVLCDSATGNPVILTYTYDDDGLITLTYTDAITGLPFAGTIGKCPNKNYGITSKEWFCLSGTTNITREDIVNLDDNTTVASIWRNSIGTVITAPTAGTFTVGVCELITEPSFEVFDGNETCPPDAEIDNYETTPIAYCYDGVTYYVSEEYTVDNETGVRTLLNTYYKNSAGVVTTEPTFTVKTIGACQFNIQENAGIERWVRLDSSTPTQSITTAQLNDRLYDTLSVSNMTPYSGDGDFRPFRGQDPQNTTVIWLEVTFFDPLTSSNYNVWYSVPSGTKLIQMEGKSIVEVTRIAVQDNTDADLTANGNNIEVKAFSNGSAPSTPVNLLFTFNLSV